MAATRPVQFTEAYEEEFQVNRPVSEETVRKLVQNVNLLRALNPVGLVKAIHIDMPGAKLPSSKLFQVCDGASIASLDSPLAGVGTTTPNLVDRFLRGKAAGGSETGGSATVDLSHTHSTGVSTHPRNLLEAGDERQAFVPAHNHTVPTGLSDAVTSDPAHMLIAFYLKVNV